MACFHATQPRGSMVCHDRRGTIQVAAVRVCQALEPNGAERLTDLRMPSSSVSLSGRFTRRTQSEGRAIGPPVR